MPSAALPRRVEFLIPPEDAEIMAARAGDDGRQVRCDVQPAQRIADDETRPRDTEGMLSHRGQRVMPLPERAAHLLGIQDTASVSGEVLLDPLLLPAAPLLSVLPFAVFALPVFHVSPSRLLFLTPG